MPELQDGARPRFIVLDNSIVAPGGHFLPYAFAVLNASKSRGYQPVLVAHRKFSDAENAGLQVECVYRYDTWPIASQLPLVRWMRLNVLRTQKPSSAKSNEEASARGSILAALRARYGDFDFAMRSRGFERGTFAAFERLHPKLRDLVFLPNAWIPELHGLAAALDRYGGPVGASIHILLRREFGSGDLASLTKALRRLGKPLTDKPVFFYTDTPELSQLYSETFGVEFQTLPIPHPINAIAAHAGGSPVRVCYIGDARSEKGFAVLPKLVSGILAQVGSQQTIRFVIQASAPSTGLEPDASEALDRLRALDSSIASVFTEIQERSSYEETILSSDIILLPYKADLYRYRSSGVLIEALSAGVPVLVPEGTWLASEVRRFRLPHHASHLITDGLAGAIFESDDHAAERLDYMLKHLREFQSLARDCASHVRSRHNPDRLVDALAERAQAALPSLREAIPRDSRHAG